jgi:hypothetical protein
LGIWKNFRGALLRIQVNLYFLDDKEYCVGTFSFALGISILCDNTWDKVNNEVLVYLHRLYNLDKNDRERI